jgi:hypothetical protein
LGNVPRTIEANIRVVASAAAAAGNGSVMEWGSASPAQRFGLLVLGDGTLYFVGDNLDLHGQRAIADATWHRVTVSYDSLSIAIYIDGALDASSSMSSCCVGRPFSQLSTTSTSLRVGENVLGGEQFIGDVASVSIYDLALSAVQVGGNSTPAPISRFSFWGGSGVSGPFVDQINPANSLTLVGR